MDDLKVVDKEELLNIVNVVKDNDEPLTDELKPFGGKELNVDPEGRLPEHVREAVKQKLMSGELTSDEVAMKERIKNMSNKKKFKLGIKPDGYKAGFTKPTIEKKKANNRKKSKVARASRKANR